jgi:heptosyltransferase III
VSILAELPEAAAVAIIRLRSLGDCVLTTPAIRLLKQFRPDLRVAVVVEERFADVYAGNPDVSAILPPSMFALRRFSPDLVVNLHGGTRSLTLTAASGAQLRAGFAHLRGSGIYNLRVPTAQTILGVERRVHTAEHVASVMFWLGVPRTDIPRARLFVRNMPEPPGPGNCAVIHAVAATPEKTWPAERFIAVARELREHGVEPVYIGGPGDDLSAFAEFRTAAGQSLERTKSLLASASLFVGNDSGPAHMAAAFGVPVVVLFGPSDSTVWAPWRTEFELLQANPIDGIGTSAVLAAAQKLLARPEVRR